MDIFFQIGVMFIIATIGAYIARLLKQPMIPAYILTGIIIGPILGLITSSEVIITLSEIGIAFLLFIVGLELNFEKLKHVGLIVSVGTIIQVSLLFIIGYFVGHLLGFTGINLVYLGLIIAFSSTMIVVKLLSDKRELDTLHGRIMIGMLLMQDLIAIFALSLLLNLNGAPLTSILLPFAKAAGIILVAFLLSSYVFPRIIGFAAKSKELLFLAALSVCFLFSLAASYIGFSIAIGAFIAGISLANLPYNIEIIGRVKSIRDFFATLFFVALGLELSIESFSALVIPLVVLSLTVILLKPIITLIICTFFGYVRRTSFLTSISLAQVSEFSLIIVMQGLLLGHISDEIFSLTVLLAVVTIGATSYFIKFDTVIYRWLSKYLHVFEIVGSGEDLQYLPHDLEYDVLIIGSDRIGYNIFSTIKNMDKSFIVIDFNPDIIKRLVDKKVPCIYGDISDPEILDRINLKKVQLVVSTVPNFNDNLYLIKTIKQYNEKAKIFTTANVIDEALQLYKKGADYVILPHFLGGEKVSSLIEDVKTDTRKINMNKLEHIDHLKERMELQHEHPVSEDAMEE